MILAPAAPPVAGSLLPTAVLEAVKASVDQTHAAYFSKKPVLVVDSLGHHEGPCIAGIISFLGEVSWSFSWIMTKEFAPKLAEKFAGFEIPFESSDMGDVAGEIVNVIAGEIVAQLERRKIKSQMTLPTVARGCPLELVPEVGPAIVNLEYTSSEGTFWVRLAAAKSHNARLSGR